MSRHFLTNTSQLISHSSIFECLLHFALLPPSYQSYFPPNGVLKRKLPILEILIPARIRENLEKHLPKVQNRWKVLKKRSAFAPRFREENQRLMTQGDKGNSDPCSPVHWMFNWKAGNAWKCIESLSAAHRVSYKTFVEKFQHSSTFPTVGQFFPTRVIVDSNSHLVAVSYGISKTALPSTSAFILLAFFNLKLRVRNLFSIHLHRSFRSMEQ